MIVCALGTRNSSILTSPRVDYAMARDGLFFRVLRGVHVRFHTPANALLFQALFILGALALTLNSLIEAPLRLAFAFGVMSIGMIFYARWRKPMHWPFEDVG